ncbi:serine/threonine-protein kinase [Legionella septentrionalis]|uniref:serine/threonine-protein kinase n=1 Tax=Legionella septentrionalis TaxID=2498109 RepID=UPI000F8EF52E|nr:serine/threonine-protein kinase [Legionella septentrionalis]RUR09369.1 serine/threonine protein kinase [Legionella septentrionalis]
MPPSMSSLKAPSLVIKGEKLKPESADPSERTQISIENSRGIKNSYALMQTLGHGAFGKVSKGINTQTGSIKAIKKVKLTFNESQQFINDIEALEKEAEVGAEVGYTEALLFFANAGKKRIDAYMVSEFCQGMDLQKFIREGKYSPEEFLIVMRGMFDEMNRIHKLGIIHADFKPANFLVNEDLTVKVIDYGFAAFAAEGNKETRGTPKYSPAESFQGADISQKGDIYSVGVTALEGLGLVHEETLSINGNSILRMVPNANLEKELAKACPKLSSKQVKILANLLEGMTKQAPSKRLDPKDFEKMLAVFDKEILKIPPVPQLIGNVEKLLNDVISMLEERAAIASPKEKTAIEKTLGNKAVTPEQLKHPKTLYALRAKIVAADNQSRHDFTFARQIMGEFNSIAKRRLGGNKFTTEANSKSDAVKKLLNTILPVEPWKGLGTANAVGKARKEIEKQYQQNFRSFK